MRFMMFVCADKNTEAGVLPSKELVAAMGRFNEEMMKAGVLLAAEGIHPSSKGARVTFSRGAPTVTDGPFPDKELVAGFWMIQARGNSGTPEARHWSTAAAKASWAASSATSKSRTSRIRVATIRPQSDR